MCHRRTSALAVSLLVTLATAGAQARRAPDRVLDALGVRAATVQPITLPRDLPRSFAARAWLGGAPRTLDLAAHDVRADSFRLLVHDARGVRAAKPSPPVTYRGTVRGLPDSVVAASLIGGQLWATVRLDETSVWVVQPASPVAAAYDRAQHVAFDTAGTWRVAGRCGVDAIEPAGRGGGRGVTPQVLLLAELAVDADFDYYKRNGGSVSATEARITTIVNGVDAIYRRDVEITIKISTILVRTTATYTQTDPRFLLPEFQVLWNRLHRTVRRDMAHLFTGKGAFTGVLGMAYLGSVCHQNTAYGVSKAYHANLGMNVGLVAHQLGHNWDALHCDGKTPCNLMCSTLGGCSNDLTSFGSESKSVIQKFKATRRCLDDARPPTLTGISPNQVMILRAPRITLIGTVLESATEVQLGPAKITALTATSTSVSFDLPLTVPLGTHPVTVMTPAGKSNALTLTVQETRPPRLLVPSASIGNFPITFRFGAAANGIWVLIVSTSNQSFKFMGFDVLQNFLPLAAGQLDAAGLGSFTITPAGIKGIVWSQIATWKAGVFDGASQFHSTFFF